MNDIILDSDGVILTKGDLVNYESIRRSGHYNMIMDSSIVMEILWPDRDESSALKSYSYLIKNYTDLMKAYFPDDYEFPKFEEFFE